MAIKLCLHCKQPYKKTGAHLGTCAKCLALPRCSKCTVVMCNKKEHIGKKSKLDNGKCDTCTPPLEYDPHIQQILKTYPRIALIIK